MVRVKILTPHSLGGGRDVFPGDVVELTEDEARLKLYRGWAEHYEDREPEATNREPKRRGAREEHEQ